MGLWVDVATLSALGARAFGVATALTAQGRSFRAEPVQPAMLRAQLEAIGAVDAVKVGMVYDRAALAIIAKVRARWRVVDPVTRTSRGEKLSTLAARDYLALADASTVITPNVGEARWLTGEDDARAAGRKLVNAGFAAAVIKGSDTAVDWVFSAGAATRLTATPLKRTSDHRGTGCRFASAMAVHLARGESVIDAARAAKHFVRSYLST